MVSSPPKRRANWREIAKPRPVPPNMRVVETSAWTKGSKIVARFSAGIPMPVSCTAMDKVLDSTRARSSTAPSWVNLTALLTRLLTICRRRWGSPMIRGGSSDSCI